MKNKSDFNLWQWILILVAFYCLMACQGEAQETHEAGDFKVEFLFEHDGCKVYRFNDGRTVYFSDCRGKIEHTTTTHANKSTVTHHHETLNN